MAQYVVELSYDIFTLVANEKEESALIRLDTIPYQCRNARVSVKEVRDMLRGRISHRDVCQRTLPFGAFWAVVLSPKMSRAEVCDLRRQPCDRQLEARDAQLLAPAKFLVENRFLSGGEYGLICKGLAYILSIEGSLSLDDAPDNLAVT